MFKRLRVAAAGFGILAVTAMPALSQGTLRIGMTAADVPQTTGQPDQGFEGFRFAGYTIYDALVNWDNAAIANDFGVPVEGCEVPWNTVQFAFAHDSATVPQPPQTIPALLDWIKANPGQFTYPARSRACPCPACHASPKGRGTPRGPRSTSARHRPAPGSPAALSRRRP